MKPFIGKFVSLVIGCNTTKKHVSKIKGVGILIAKYIGTTDELLQNSSLSDKLTGLIHPKFRFKYSGKY